MSARKIEVTSEVTSEAKNDVEIREGVLRARGRLARGSRSFALAGKLLPRGVRDDAAVLYAWCRRTDDATDDLPPDEAAAALREAKRTLAGVYDGAPQRDPELHAFQEVVQRRGIPRSYPEEMLAGMAMDVEGHAYATFEELRLYCYRVAGTVGLMMAHVMGLEDPRFLQHAAELGMAMQLTNIARDVDEDWRRGRLYVPAAWLPAEVSSAPRGGGVPAELAAPLAAAVQRLLAEAEVLYRRGDEGLAGLRTRAAVGVAAARRIYAEIGARLARQGFDVRAGRAVVPGWRKLTLAAGAATAVLWQRLWRARASGEPRRQAPWPHTGLSFAALSHASPSSASPSSTKLMREVSP